MTAILLLLAVLAAFGAWLKLNRRLSGDIFSPFSLLLPCWALPLSLRLLSLSTFESSWEPGEMVVLMWVTTALAAPSLLGWLLRDLPSFASTAAVFEAGLRPCGTTRFASSVVVLFAIAFAVYVYAEFVTNPYGIPLVSVLSGTEISSAAHRWGKDAVRWSAISGTLFILVPVLYLAFRASPPGRQKRLLLLLTALWPIGGVLKLSNSDVFVSVLNIALAETYWRKYRPGRPVWSWRALLAVSLAVACGMYAVLRVRLGSDAPNFLEVVGLKDDVPAAARLPVGAVYAYFALPYENFHRFLLWYEGGVHPGISFLRPVVSALGQGRLADAETASIEWQTLSGQTAAVNTGTFLTPLYAELGTAGLVVVPGLYGLLMGWLYRRLRRDPTLPNLLLYVNFVYPWTWLFFTNAFSALTFYLNAALAMLLGHLAMPASLGQRESGPRTGSEHERWSCPPRSCG